MLILVVGDAVDFDDFGAIGIGQMPPLAVAAFRFCVLAPRSVSNVCEVSCERV